MKYLFMQMEMKRSRFDATMRTAAMPEQSTQNHSSLKRSEASVLTPGSDSLLAFSDESMFNFTLLAPPDA